jgi:hypothetical protein
METHALWSLAVAAALSGPACRRPAGQAETTENPAGVRGTASPAAGRRVAVEVVSTNPAAQMVTVRPSSSGDQPAAATGAVETALPVQGEAARMLGMLRSGDRVILTCEPVAGAEESPPAAVDGGALGAPCPTVIRIERVDG